MTHQLPISPTPWRGRAAPPQGAIQRSLLAVRMPEEFLHRLDTSMVRVQATQPSLRLRRAAAIRTLLDKGLRAAGG